MLYMKPASNTDGPGGPGGSDGPKIARRHVSSSVIRSAGYDLTHATLEIEFVSGLVYRYHAVPRSVWYGLMDASSKGSYFDAHIRNRFPTMRQT